MKSSGRKKTWPPLKANTTSAMAIPMASVRSTLFFSCWGASYVAEDGDSFRPPRTLSAMRSCSCFMAGRQLVKRQRLQGPNRAAASGLSSGPSVEECHSELFADRAGCFVRLRSGCLFA